MSKLTHPSYIRELLQDLDIRPKKLLGQHFLIDDNILRIIMEYGQVSAGDAVLEIGPGLGVLTEKLVERAHHVVAIEKDDVFHAYLEKRFQGVANFELIHADALKVDLPDLVENGLGKLIANLPYSAGSRILIELIKNKALPERMVVMLQRDVAERLTASPGTKAFGILAVWAQLDYRVRAPKFISPTCFYPPPKVQSALVVFEREPGMGESLTDRDHFSRLIKWSFSQRRKQIGNLLHNASPALFPGGCSPQDALDRLSIDHAARPENLSVAQWVALSNLVIRPAAG